MTDPTQDNPNLELLRGAEGDLLLAHLRPGMKVLEIGGGSGFHAKLVHDRGCEVISIDLEGRKRPAVQHFPVGDYDGIHLPVGDATCDAVWSSSVLEHIRDLPAMLREIRRVLKPDGFALHIVPSPVWRFWTIATRYPYFARLFLDPERAAAVWPEREGERRGRLFRAARLVKTALIEPPHGEHPSAVAELYHYRRSAWRRVFEENGYDVVDARGNDLFYTGYTTFPGLSVASRRRLARLLGLVCHVFVVKPARS